jgi:hypothetical protein
LVNTRQAIIDLSTVRTEAIQTVGSSIRTTHVAAGVEIGGSYIAHQTGNISALQARIDALNAGVVAILVKVTNWALI